MSMAGRASASLSRRLRQRIREQGPVSAGVFISEALFDPREGFYATKDPIGAGEDFITAPEVSQMFGELIGLWLAQAWQRLGAPRPVQLIELGPGRGTMMKDILRAARAVPGFAKALNVTLVEISPALITVQAQSLDQAPCPVHWRATLQQAPKGPGLILGNEFLDCLPVRQLVRQGGNWHERLVDCGPDGGFCFVLDPVPAPASVQALIPPALREAQDGALVEVRPAIATLAEHLAERFAAAPGLALFIDYGPAQSEPGDSLQAIRAHQKVDPLAAPGSADLTTRVDFAELARIARNAGLQVFGPVPQGQWLKALGLEYRAADLMRKHPEQKARLARQVHRLSDAGEMGTLFKAIAIAAPGTPAPDGFAP